MSTRTTFALLLIAIASSFAAPVQAAVTERICLLQLEVDFAECAAAEDAVAACTNAVRARPNDFNSRASLCEAHVANGDYAAAVQVLNDGKPIHRGDDFTMRLIDRVLSNVTEAQSAGDGPGPSVGTLVDYMVLRCTMIKNLQNCDEALAIDPDNTEALNGRGDILAAEGDTSGAVAAYRKSLSVLPDQAAITQKLDAILDTRRQQVAACLATTTNAGIAACREVLVEGEIDAYDIHSKIGNLELATGSLSRALAAYNAADAARSTAESRQFVAVLNVARDCIDSRQAALCTEAANRVPNSQLFRNVRAAVTLAGCRTLVASGSGNQAAQDVCTEARTLNSSRQSVDEIDGLLAALQTPDVAAPVAADPESPPSDELTSQCLALVARGNDGGDAIALCERAAREEAGAAAAPLVLTTLAELRSKRDDRRVLDECNSAADQGNPAAAIDICRTAMNASTDAPIRGQIESILATLEFDSLAIRCSNEDDNENTLTVCRNALSRAPADADRLPVQNRIAQLEQQFSDAATLASLRERCMNFSSMSLGVALTSCQSAVERLPTDPDVLRAMQTVEGLVEAYRNDPIRLSRGIEAVTY